MGEVWSAVCQQSCSRILDEQLMGNSQMIKPRVQGVAIIKSSLNAEGPRMDLRGAPQVRGAGDEENSPIMTEEDLPDN